MKTTIIIDAEEDPSVVEAFMKVFNGFLGAATNFMDSKNMVSACGSLAYMLEYVRTLPRSSTQ